MVKNSPWRLVSVCSIVAVVALGLVIAGQPQPIVKPSADSNSTRPLTAFGKLPLYFIENQGQVDRHARYYLQGKDKSVYFTSDGVLFVLSAEEQGESKRPFHPASYRQPEPRDRWAVKLDFVGANPEVQPVGLERTEATVSYFKGRQADWKTGLATYASVAYEHLWPGINLNYAGTDGRLKYTFTVAPGADPRQVRLAYHGATGVNLNEQGQLRIETSVGGFAEDKPYVYQEIDGRQVEVESAYELEGTEYGFRLGDYDHTRPLILDPVVLVYAGYIGGLGAEFGDAIAVDTGGNAYIAGWAAADDDWSGLGFEREDSDVFIAKVNTAGTALLYLAYLGGSSWDRAFGIAVDAAGSAYITGGTLSTESTFPVKAGPDTTYNGGSWAGDAFVAKLNAMGTALDYCGYIGGSAPEVAFGLALDTSGNAYVTGWTFSVETTFPVKVGPDLSFNDITGNPDVFVAKVNVAGTELSYAGYIGGSDVDQPTGIAVDGAGNAYVVGQTASTQDSFPVVVGPDLTHNGGWFDAFVVKVNALGTGLTYAGYIGGAGTEFGRRIALDGDGHAYVTGDTDSNQTTFPVKAGPDMTYNGNGDAFVAKVKLDGSGLVYGGYIGGSDNDGGLGIAVDDSGSAYVSGWTNSSAGSFPVKDGPGLTYSGGQDAFVAKVNTAGTALVYAGYLGGSGTEGIYYPGIALDSAGNVYVTGTTSSNQATFPVKVGPDRTFNGGKNDAYVAKIKYTPALEANAGPDQVRECASPNGTLVTLDGSGSSDPEGDPLSYRWTGPFGLATGVKPKVKLACGSHSITLTVNDGHGHTATDTVAVRVRDTKLPSTTIHLTPNVLWPPDHRMVAITAKLTASDQCDQSPKVVLMSIVNSEPGKGLEPGDIPVDVQDAALGTDDRTFLLRAERYSKGTGRTYTVVYDIRDASGNKGRVTGVVTVPLTRPN